VAQEVKVKQAKTEADLWDRFSRTRDPTTREDLVHLYLPSARGIALGFSRGGESFDDLLRSRVSDCWRSRRPTCWRRWRRSKPAHALDRPAATDRWRRGGGQRGMAGGGGRRLRSGGKPPGADERASGPGGTWAADPAPGAGANTGGCRCWSHL